MAGVKTVTMETMWITLLTFGVLSLESTRANKPGALCSPVNSLYQHPNDCHQFMVCAPWGYIARDCPAKLVFDTYMKRCNYGDLVPRCYGQCLTRNPCVRGLCYTEASGSLACDCQGTGYTGPTCNELGTCQTSNPCVRGVCYTEASGSLACDCQGTGYTGPTCNELGTCQTSNPCVRGVCYTEANGSLACDCQGTDYTGPTCNELNIFCPPSVCKHGRCLSATNYFYCDCRGFGYEGTFCQIPVPGIACQTSDPCSRGQCVSLTSGVFCNCEGTGYTGSTCNQLVIGGDACFQGACRNGVCVSANGSYTCNCAGTVYIGPRCDMTACNYDGYNPCMNGGTCTPLIKGDYRCTCLSEFTGDNCEYLTPRTNCPVYPCPIDVPLYNYPDWGNINCSSYYSCVRGSLQLTYCNFGQKFDVITMTCKNSNDPVAIFCSHFLM